MLLLWYEWACKYLGHASRSVIGPILALVEKFKIWTARSSKGVLKMMQNTQKYCPFKTYDPYFNNLVPISPFEYFSILSENVL